MLDPTSSCSYRLLPLALISAWVIFLLRKCLMHFGSVCCSFFYFLLTCLVLAAVLLPLSPDSVYNIQCKDTRVYTYIDVLRWSHLCLSYLGSVLVLSFAYVLSWLQVNEEMRSSRRIEVSVKSSAQQLTDHNIGTGMFLKKQNKKMTFSCSCVLFQSWYSLFTITWFEFWNS